MQHYTFLCLLCLLSACSDSKTGQEGAMPLDPVVYERELRKAKVKDIQVKDIQVKNKELVSPPNPLEQKQIVLAEEGSGLEDVSKKDAVVTPAPSKSKLSNSFKLIAKSNADPSALAAHAAADAMGVPDVPSSRIAEPMVDLTSLEDSESGSK